jgi:hypothetical protein
MKVNFVIDPSSRRARRSCCLRAASPNESARLHKALEKWADPYVLGRPESDLRAAAETGLFFLVTDPGDSEILGTSAVFSLRDGEYVEVGTTYVDERLRGFRLQELFFRIRIASIVWSQGTGIQITTAIDPNNERSLRSTRTCGFRDMTELIDEQLAPCIGCTKRPPLGSGRACCCNFYVLPDDAARGAVRALLDQVVNGAATLRNGSGDELELRVTAKVATDPDARAALAELVAGRTW